MKEAAVIGPALTALGVIFAVDIVVAIIGIYRENKTVRLLKSGLVTIKDDDEMFATKQEWQQLHHHGVSDTEYDDIWNALVSMEAGDHGLHGCIVRKVEHGCHPLGGNQPQSVYTAPTFYVEDGQFLASDPLHLYDAVQRVNRNRRVLLGYESRYVLGKRADGQPWDLKLLKLPELNK